MTLEDLTAKYAGLIHRQSAAELKANPVFMKACRENEDFREYVLSQKPTMATVKVSGIKFKRPDGIIGHTEPKQAQIERVDVKEPEPVEEVSKAVQLYREVVEYGNKNGFLL
jgi:hypothetical protein